MGWDERGAEEGEEKRENGKRRRWVEREEE